MLPLMPKMMLVDFADSLSESVVPHFRYESLLDRFAAGSIHLLTEPQTLATALLRHCYTAKCEDHSGKLEYSEFETQFVANRWV